MSKKLLAAILGWSIVGVLAVYHICSKRKITDYSDRRYYEGYGKGYADATEEVRTSYMKSLERLKNKYENK